MLHTVGGNTYELVKENRNGWNPEAFRERYSEVLERYDYIVGDWGYSQLRLRGFNKETNPKTTKETSIASLDDYLNEYCNFGCAYFIVEKMNSGKPVRTDDQDSESFHADTDGNALAGKRTKYAEHSEENFDSGDESESEDDSNGRESGQRNGSGRQGQKHRYRHDHRAEKAEHGDRSKRDKGDKGRSGRSDHTDKPNRPQRSDRTERNGKAERVDELVPSNKAVVERVERNERQPHKSERAVKAERGSRDGRASKRTESRVEASNRQAIAVEKE